MRFERLLTAVFILLPVSVAWPQTPAPIYDPRVAFAPLTLPDPVNAYRSGNGAPGPAYWQNEADYEMHAALDTKAKTLQNDEVITYTNNSPDCAHQSVDPAGPEHLSQRFARLPGQRRLAAQETRSGQRGEP